MDTTQTYQKAKTSCKFCGRKRDGKPGLLCAHCRRVRNAADQRALYWRKKAEREGKAK